MTEYTPDTQDVRHAWSLFWHASIDSCKTLDQYEAEFDRWLAQVKADAWDEGFSRAHRQHDAEDLRLSRRTPAIIDDNPYRKETT